MSDLKMTKIRIWRLLRVWNPQTLWNNEKFTLRRNISSNQFSYNLIFSKNVALTNFFSHFFRFRCITILIRHNIVLLQKRQPLDHLQAQVPCQEAQVQLELQKHCNPKTRRKRSKWVEDVDKVLPKVHRLLHRQQPELAKLITQR